MVDLSNLSTNIISDLGPLLALFGEQVAKQFMSESTGLSDNILFAMAPLGIITASVGAIRIGGPNWMKAVIGRARENKAIAEIELMSSTSHEVCELWNGQQIVRIMGAPPIRELVCITRNGGVEKLYTLKGAKTEGGGAVLRKKSGDRFQRLKGKIGHSITAFLFLLVGYRDKPAALTNPEDGRKPAPSPNSRNKRFDEAPNISLNVNAHVSRWELRFFALIATLFQASVLIYAHFAANNQSLRLVFGRLGEYDESSWAVHLVMIGTLGVVMGMLICAFIIEHSTREEQYHACKPNDRVHVIWLQKSAAVSDQAFDSYAIFGEESRQVITTSRRNQKFNSPGHDIMFSVLTILGVVAGLLGFLIQMIGYRGMHWTVSVAQLLAIIFTTIIRAWVRRGLSAPTHAIPLPLGYEIDWLATRMAQHHSQLRDPQLWRNHGMGGNMEDSELPESFKGQDCYEWDIITGAKSLEYEKLSLTNNLGHDEHRPATDEIVSYEVETTPASNPIPASALIPSGQDNHLNGRSRPVIDTTLSKAKDNNRAQMVMSCRKDLGRLTRWSGPAADKATSVAKAIEIVLRNTKFSPKNMDMTGKVLKWQLHAFAFKPEQINLEIRHDGKQWKVDVADIEAVLSLWLFAAVEKERGIVAMDDKSDSDAWLRSGEASRGDSIRLLGESNTVSRRDMRWWAGSANSRVIEVSSTPDEKETIELSSHRVVGYSGYKPERDNANLDVRQEACKRQYQIHMVSDDNNNMPENESFTRRKISLNSVNEVIKSRTRIRQGTNRSHKSKSSGIRSDHGQALATNPESGKHSLATMTNVPLEGLFALDIFSAFMWAYAQTPQFKRVAGDTTIQQSDRVISGGGDVSWQSFTLKNSTLSKIAENVSRTGLASVEDVYLTIIPPLSKFRRLPDAGVAIEYASQQAKLYELSAEWDRASQCHLWALSICEPFDPKEEAAIYAIASFTEYLKSLKEVADIMAEHKYNQKDIQWFRKTRESLAKTLRRFSDSYTRQKIHEIYIIQKRAEGNEIWNYQENAGEPSGTKESSIPLKFNRIHQAVISDHINSAWADIDKDFREGPEEIRRLVKEKDALGWTPLHYAVTRENYQAVNSLLKWGAEWDVLNLAEWSPLHFAARSKLPRSLLRILRTAKLDVNIQGRGGLTPLYFAVRSNNVLMAEALIDNGANIQTIDNFRRTLLHWAAHYGSSDVARVLLQKGANKDSSDDVGRTALHLAALRGKKEILEALLSSGADMEALDRDGKTPIQMSNNPAILHLLKVKGANMSKNPNDYCSALQAATKDKNIAGVKELLAAGADPNCKLGSALHTAIKIGEKNLIEIFLANKAAMDFTNKKGETVTALKVAIDAGDLEVFHLLISKGAKKKDSNALRSAARAGYKEIVEFLVNAEADPNVKDKNGSTALHTAAEAGRYNIIEYLVSRNIDLTAKNKHGSTALEIAVKLGHVQIINLLVSHMKASVNIKNNSGETALHVGVRGEKEGAVQKLLDQGADIHIQNNLGQTALHLSALLPKDKMVNLLLRYKADPTIKDKYGETAAQVARKSGVGAIENILIRYEITSNKNHEDLHIAARAGNKAVVSDLLDEGKLVDSLDTNGGTALQAASSKGHHEVVKQLLDAKSRVDLQDHSGRTALQAASEAGHELVLSLLFEHGAGIDIKDNEGRTALFLAAAAGKHQVVRVLVQKGADIITQDESHYTPLSIAIEKSHEEVVCVLLEHGVDSKDEDHSAAIKHQRSDIMSQLSSAKGGELLEKAILTGNEKIVQLLLDNGVDANAPGDKHGSALQAALFSDDVEWLPSLGLIELLFERGADINAHSNEHCSALQTASAEGYVEVVKFLLEKEVDISIQGGSSPNALLRAISRGNKDVVKLLLEGGANINAQTAKYGTALQATAATRNVEMAEFLIENGAELDSPEDIQDNALQVAACGGDTDLVRLLLGHGADVNAHSGDQGSALVQAARYGHLEIVQMLLEKGSNESDYGIALTQASGNGYKEVVSLLLAQGADANADDREDGCALVQAAKNGFLDVVKTLLLGGADANIALIEAVKNGSHIDVILALLKSVTDKSVIGDACKAADENGHKDLLALLMLEF